MRRLTLTVAALMVTAFQATAATAVAANPAALPGYQCGLSRRLPTGTVEGLGACQAVGGAPANGPVTRPFFIADLGGGRFECQSGRAELPHRVSGENCIRTR